MQTYGTTSIWRSSRYLSKRGLTSSSTHQVPIPDPIYEDFRGDLTNSFFVNSLGSQRFAKMRL